MMRTVFLTTTLILAFSIISISQDLSYGFRSGLNFSTLNGDLETGESLENQTGFHIGIGFSNWFTDIWGARAEILYSQKGVKQKYNGDSFLFLVSNDGDNRIFDGTKNEFLNITNSYLDIPITAYARITDWLEISAGVSPGFLIGSTANGEMQFTNSTIADLSFELDYKYSKDKPGDGDFTSTDVYSSNFGEKFTFPSSLGAYYFHKEDNGNLYNFFNLDLVAGLAFYFNRGLYLGGRMYYGLMDVTKQEVDFARSQRDGNDYISRDDKDKNFTIQASVGFNF